MKLTDEFSRDWIINNALEEIKNYEKGMLTLRGLHYRLVSRGMTNSLRHYKRVVSAMIKARWDGLVSFDTFSDHDRAMLGETAYTETTAESAIETAKYAIKDWMEYYFKNRWENQPNYVEVFIEKKALQGVFEKVCRRHRVGLGACKGYPSLTFLNDAAERFKEATEAGKKCIILYFGDYDPSGEDIPRSIGQNLYNLGCEVEVKRMALMEHQVLEWDLPLAPTKLGDSRTANWTGLGQVELDSVDINHLMELCKDAIEDHFDNDLHSELLDDEASEREEYKAAIKEFVKTLE